PKGGLDLMNKSAVLGKDGPVSPGKPEASKLWELVSTGKMPPKKPLPPAEKVLLKEWIAGGAKWGADPIDAFATTTEKHAGRDWWSLQPIKRPAVPDPKANPIDAFIRAKLSDR